MTQFSKDQRDKYAKYSLTGTAFLTFRDIEKILIFHDIDRSNALDFGCGFGRSTSFLFNLCGSITGADISKESIDVAKKTHDNIKFFELNKKDMLYGEGEYTLIFSIFVTCHFSSKEELMTEMEKARKSLKKGGHIIIISMTKFLFYKNYASVKYIDYGINKEGEKRKVLLKDINCIVEDYYWSDGFLRECGEAAGFSCIGVHYPLGEKEDNQNYKDEYIYPPSFILVLKKI